MVAGMRARLAAAEAAAPGAVRHSVCRWCYGGIPLEDLCVAARDIGIDSIELLDPKDFPLIKKHGLSCAMVNGGRIEGPGGTRIGSIPKAFNRLEHHDLLVKAYEPVIEAAADAGFRQVICFSGNREGMSDEQGLDNCAVGIRRLLPACERHGVTLVMELLNSRVDHADYMCDRTAWGVALCEKLQSPHFKLLYDIYHMQIMEGDVIATIRRHHPHIAHYHTGGVPGRGEIDETQELNYSAIIRAIRDTGFTGHVAQEFVPKRPDKLASLRQGVQICTVAPG
ncbi:MAG: hydroxypyruvate isomerase [Planctomycetia bacterium]|nr:hydroxypyruvate isomerase [Planctomycetia bacterium]